MLKLQELGGLLPHGLWGWRNSVVPSPATSLSFLLQALYSFLAQPNALVHLDLSGTDCVIDLVSSW